MNKQFAQSNLTSSLKRALTTPGGCCRLLLMIMISFKYQMSRVDAELSERDFNWSLAPIYHWLRFIGIDLRDPDSSCLKWAAFLVNVAIQISYYATEIHNPHIQQTLVEEKVSTKSFSITYVLDLVNISVQTGAAYLLLSFDIRKKWIHLWHFLEDMKHRFHPDLNMKLRRRSVIGTIYIVISVNTKIIKLIFVLPNRLRAWVYGTKW